MSASAQQLYLLPLTLSDFERREKLYRRGNYARCELMRIVHFITSLEQGGAQAVLFDVVMQFKKRSYKQAIVYVHDGPFAARFKDADIDVYQLRGSVFSFDPIALYRLIRILKKIKPYYLHTVLWAANWMGRIAARLLSIRCAVSLHNNYDQNGCMRRLLDRCVPYKVYAIIAVSDEVKKSFMHSYPHANVTVIQNGIDIAAIKAAAYAQQKTRAQLGLKESDFVIGTVGRLTPIKEYPLLLEAFAQIHASNSQARLVIIGHGEQEKELREYAKTLKIAPYIRWIVGKQAYGYYNLFDCFVLASQKEGISIALLEAMSLGVVPINSYHSAQHPVIIEGQNGRVAKAGKATDFAAKIEECRTSNELSITLAKNAQHDVQNRFAIKSMIAAYSRIFETIQM